VADSLLSITVRDTTFPCAPYRTTEHSFLVDIFNCDGLPLFWKGLTYISHPLDTAGAAGGRVHGQVKIPAGSYLVRAKAQCKNVVSDWAWVNVGCDETVCVDIVLPSVRDCINRVLAGLQLGTVDPPAEGEEMVRDVVGEEEVKRAVEVLTMISERLPRTEQLPEVPTEEQLRQTFGRFEEQERAFEQADEERRSED
jgi:hypothetical protein